MAVRKFPPNTSESMGVSTAWIHPHGMINVCPASTDTLKHRSAKSLEVVLLKEGKGNGDQLEWWWWWWWQQWVKGFGDSGKVMVSRCRVRSFESTRNYEVVVIRVVILLIRMFYLQYPKNVSACVALEDHLVYAARLASEGGTSRKTLRPRSTWYHTEVPPKSAHHRRRRRHGGGEVVTNEKKNKQKRLMMTMLVMMIMMMMITMLAMMEQAAGGAAARP
jgi:hypothetical protein